MGGYSTRYTRWRFADENVIIDRFKFITMREQLMGRTTRWLVVSIVCVVLPGLLWSGATNSHFAQTKVEQKSTERSIVPPDDGKLRIICFGAHPDDCELQAGGVALLWAKQGHHLKFVSVTNGDIGHWRGGEGR